MLFLISYVASTVGAICGIGGVAGKGLLQWMAQGLSNSSVGIFSLRDKEAVVSSLFINYISQLSSVLMQVVTKTVPDASWTLLLTMICCGIAGGIVGRMSSSKLSGKATKMMFVALNLIIVCIPCWNIYRYLS